MNQTQKIKRLIAVLLATLIGGLGMMKNAVATTSMFVSPMSQKILLVPGETYEGAITVASKNQATETLYYHLSTGPYSVAPSENSKDDYGNVDITTKNNMNLMMDWISFDKTSGEVMPNQSVNIPFYIHVPTDAPAGAQYATILVTEADQSGASENGINVSSDLQIASVIFANVAGKTVETGEIVENTMPSFLTSGPLEAVSMVKNTGNIYTDASYVLQVWPLFSSEEICTNEENPATSLILPDTERYHAETCELPVFGIFKAKQTVSIFGETSVLDRTVVKCPIWLLFIIIFAIIAAIIWLVMRARGRKESESEDEKGEKKK